SVPSPGVPWERLPEDSPLRDFFKRYERGMPQEREANSLGSGFIISADGKILTNAHVVDGAESIIVKLNDRTEKPAKLIGLDKATDVALLKIDAKNLPVAKFGDSDKLVVGEWVLAIGSPFGLEYTATHGIVSALARPISGSNYVPFIQTDVPVNPGNSGGPLYNMRGEVVGINSQIYSRTGGYMGLSFAIPANIARNVATQLEQSGSVSRGWLGVSIQGVSSDMAKALGLQRPMGALVGDVDMKGPASRAGLKSGDVIIEYDGQTIEEESSLPPRVAATPIGRSVPLKVWRDKKAVTVSVTVAALKNDKLAISDEKAGEPAVKPILNVAVADVPPELRERMELKTGGVLVTDVNPGPAARAGIQDGDVILKLDGKSIESATQFTKLVASLPRERPIAVHVQREGGKLYLAMTIPKQ
ncbi:MAG: DegQ family serine endoprotease, partial [Candidatus Obscuribacterales bacterium]|nr:DegQ family serine endoprotease [Steroidobacteraceae bacterium]